MDSIQTDLQAIRQLLAELTARVYRLEQIIHPSAPAPAPVAAPIHEPPPPTAAPPLPPPFVPPTHAPPPPIPVAPYHPTTRPAESDLETRIGSHWLNRIGIAAVLIGVSYFLKLAFDNNWIGPAARVSIGVLAGLGIVAGSERFRSRGFAAFSYSLKAVGIGALYFSLWAAYQLYNLIPSGVAFLAMFVVTFATAALALAEDAEILAVFAITGGFATPFLLSTGSNREVALFAYITVLDLATLVLVRFKPWRRPIVLSLIGTALYTGWCVQFYRHYEFPTTIAFATVFFTIFAVTPLFFRYEEIQLTLASFAFFLTFLNAALYFLSVYAMLDYRAGDTADLAFALAGIYLLLSRLLQAKAAVFPAARALQLLHIALAIGFITAAIPLRLDGHWITIAWFFEAAALLWIGDRLSSDFIRLFALSALVLGILRLIFWDNFYPTQLIFNERMATYLIAIAVLAIVGWYANRRDDDAAKGVAAVAGVALNVLALLALGREVSDYYFREMADANPYHSHNRAAWERYRQIGIIRDFTFSALGMGYGAMLMAIGFWRRSSFVRWQALILIAVTILKVFIYDVSQLEREFRILSFIVLGILLLAISFAYQQNWLQLPRRKSAGQPA